MLGFSLPKILLTLAVIVAVWWLWRKIAVFSSARFSASAPPPSPSPGERGGGGPPSAGAIEELTPCAVCGAYAARGSARACGRADCPY